MFIKLTDLDGRSFYINVDQIMWITPYSTRGDIEASIVDMGREDYVKVIESPDMIMKIIERSENGK